ncbi:hypothetical protein LTR91_008630 [Friedmanniomyces endolithicus]|uniref:endo-1,3(4)-beta-glucanase n=1 Tax=Friedmanniomyces endolithicus TaxID=329885 RepID=A0AAN6KNJ0_9PEZI|nr:hypothetical protein LTR57_017901 [Friedmanniomyces endolithicus]KAK0967662.1 hypothetical protein LTS01_017181 [Friedmanniomyces endolithicus]KAK0991215.1 hypothetical protein LTR91_008630 [Friedmanniomyces endolithicus]KAK1038296.1 hypothetical protein LTS16_012123 [Friedmanniomyces endolithicus]
MWSSSLVPGTSIVCALSFLSSIQAQSIPGATLFSGNGAPGAGPYQLVDDYESAVFFDKFNFYSSYDPTYGHVQYVTAAVAEQNGFVTTPNSTAVISVDTTNQWPNGGPGRPAVRLISDNTYTHGLFILDLVHMPWGCGTWPAYWLLGPNWPFNGEIDIIEGVNTGESDSVSMHTNPGCEVDGAGQTGSFQTANCDKDANGNSGCGTLLSNTTIPNNYGDGLNRNGGGVYATEWTSDYVKTWFFPRGSIPASITSGAPNVSTFGTPAVNAQSGGGYTCDIQSHFANMSIIINTDFCGAWAGQVYSSQFPQCPQTANVSSLDSCVDFVGNNPSYFTQAYWQINSIKVYQMLSPVQPSSSYTTSQSTATPSASTNTVNLGMGASTATIGSSTYTGPLSSATTSGIAPTGTPAICPTYNGTTWTNANSQLYNIACGSDYNGGSSGLGDSGIQSATSFENCLEICDTVNGCLAVAFTGGNIAGTCYLKNSVGAFVHNGATNAAVRLAGPVSGVSTSSSTSSTSTVLSSSKSVSPSLAPYTTTTASTSSPSSSSSSLFSARSTSTSSSSARMTSSSVVSSSLSTSSLSPSSSSSTSASGTSTSTSESSSISSATQMTSSSSSSSQVTTSLSSTSSQASASAVARCQNNTVVTDSNGVAYTTYCGSDTTQGAFNVQYYSSGDFTQCELYCDNQAGCAAWTWSPGASTGGACFLKHAPSSPVPASGSNAALWVAGIAIQSSASSTLGSGSSINSSVSSSAISVASPSASAACPSINNTQITDSNGRNYTVFCSSDTTGGAFTNQIYAFGDFTQCMTGCDNNTGCTAWTWNKYSPGNGGVCYLKYGTQNAVPGAASLTAGVLAVPPTYVPPPAIQCPGSNGTTYNDTMGNKYIVLCGMDSVPGSFANAAEPDLPSCVNACAARMDGTARCLGVTFVGGTCYFKSQYTSSTVSTGVDSAFLSTVIYPNAAKSSSSPSSSSSSSSRPSSSTTAMTSTSSTGGLSSTGSTASSLSGAPSTIFSSTSLTSSASALATCGNAASPSASGAAAPCQDTYGNSFNVTYGTQYTGSVLIRAKQPSINACLLQCDTTANCAAVNYANGTCELLSTVTGTETVAVSGSAVAAAATRPASVSTIYTTPSTTSAMATSSLMSSSVSSSMSTTATSYNSVPTPACNSSYIDPRNGNVYTVYCRADNSAATFMTVPVSSGGFGMCFAACDAAQSCAGFTFIGGDSGMCDLKNVTGSFISAGSDTISCFITLIYGQAPPGGHELLDHPRTIYECHKWYDELEYNDCFRATLSDKYRWRLQHYSANDLFRL